MTLGEFLDCVPGLSPDVPLLLGVESAPGSGEWVESDLTRCVLLRGVLVLLADRPIPDAQADGAGSLQATLSAGGALEATVLGRGGAVLKTS